MSATNRFLVISILLPQPQNANITKAQFTEMSYLLKRMTYNGNSKVINWPKRCKLYTKLMVIHSSFHIWFGFSWTPNSKVITDVFTQPPRLVHKNSTIERKCCAAKNWPGCLVKNRSNYLNFRCTRKNKPNMKTRMGNHLFGI